MVYPQLKITTKSNKYKINILIKIKKITNTFQRVPVL